jgi:hypothetical protein
LKKSVTARYLQLKSGHAVTGEYLLRTKQAQEYAPSLLNQAKHLQDGAIQSGVA